MKEIGYGAGSKDFDFPNVLRVIQFETQSKSKMMSMLSNAKLMICHLNH